MQEIWRDIEGYNNYQVSNLGRVKSCSRFHRTNKNYSSLGYLAKERILKSGKNPKGYLIVGLYKDGIRKTHKVHRLVAEAFLPNPENLPQINHINGIKTDNRAENLEFCTCQKNIIHAYNNGHKKPSQKQKETVRKIMSKETLQYDLQGNLIRKWKSAKEAGMQLKINTGNISSCCTGRTKTAGGYIWRNNKEELLNGINSI